METYFLLSLLLCHWAADYTHLSRPFMLQAKRFGKPLFPIFLHAFVHAFLMLAVAVIFFSISVSGAIYLFLIQLCSHFIIDVTKGRMNVWYPSLQNPANVFHWWVFGADQTLHIFIIVLISKLN